MSAASRPHTFACLDPQVRTTLARLGSSELGAGVIERLMREINARTDIGGFCWTPADLPDTCLYYSCRSRGTVTHTQQPPVRDRPARSGLVRRSRSAARIRQS